MIQVYELITLLPTGYTPVFAPRLNKLLRFLKEHKELRDAEDKEMAKLYLQNGKKVKYFNKLKNELKAALSRYLIANPSWADNRNKALIENCYRTFATYKLFLLNGKRNVAIASAKNLLSKLVELDLHSMAHTVANDLHYHFSSIDPISRSAKKYEKIAGIQLEMIKAEALVRKYNSRLGFICNTRESYSPSVLAEFREAVEHTLPLLRINSHHIRRLTYSIVVARYVAEYDYLNIEKYCNEALQSFPKDHPNIRSLRFAFLHKQIPSLVALGRSDEAKEVARAAGELVPVGNFNWHIALQKRITVCLHAADYQEAYDLYSAHSKEKSLDKNIKETWLILQGYLYFLIECGFVKPYKEERFHIGKFLNEVPIYSKDKAGNNINILLLQVLIRLQKEQFGHIIDKAESIREYVRKYTRTPETKRVNIFFRMILRMVTAQFHCSGTELKTKKLRAELEKTPIRFGQNLAVEIIPYPILWEEILALLENKFRATTVPKNKKSIRPSKRG